MIPEISQSLLRAFCLCNRWYLARNFHAVRLAGVPPTIASNRSLIIYLNHPSWWDPLIALLLAQTFWPERAHYAPIDAAALERYPFLSRLGVFGIEKHGVRAASVFLKTGSAILQQSNSVLWVTGEGEFTDPRCRPVTLRPGLGHLLRRVRSAALVPLALEYPFWQERFPEALCRFGPLVTWEAPEHATPSQLIKRLEASLETTQDRLAAVAIRRCPDDFQSILEGRVGVGLFYDAWRRLRAALRGQRFSPGHGERP